MCICQIWLAALSSKGWKPFIMCQGRPRRQLECRKGASQHAADAIRSNSGACPHQSMQHTKQLPKSGRSVQS